MQALWNSQEIPMHMSTFWSLYGLFDPFLIFLEFNVSRVVLAILENGHNILMFVYVRYNDLFSLLWIDQQERNLG